jgi:4-diphosphocytidyl-2-C-methyl-D-erythritol kinase
MAQTNKSLFAAFSSEKEVLTSFAPAKVNLYLHVTARRPDGYHLLDSLAIFPAIGDRLTYAPDAELSLTLSGPFAGGLGPDNLVLRAARMLAASAGRTPGGRLRLEKNLPVASGIGGGSADAAAGLRLLGKAWQLETDFERIAPVLGADVPVCLARRAARMSGIGEVLGPAPALPVFGIVLVNPGIPVATAEVFRSADLRLSPPACLPEFWPDAAAMAAGLAVLRNDLEAPAITLAPEIGAVLARLRSLPGALLARMSGSGATCFALFETPAAAAAAAAAIGQPGWWCWGGGLYERGSGDL